MIFDIGPNHIPFWNTTDETIPPFAVMALKDGGDTKVIDGQFCMPVEKPDERYRGHYFINGQSAVLPKGYGSANEGHHNYVLVDPDADGPCAMPKPNEWFLWQGPDHDDDTPFIEFGFWPFYWQEKGPQLTRQFHQRIIYAQLSGGQQLSVGNTLVTDCPVLVPWRPKDATADVDLDTGFLVDISAPEYLPPNDSDQFVKGKVWATLFDNHWQFLSGFITYPP